MFWKVDSESGAYSNLAGNTHAPTMSLHDMLDNGQAQAGSPVLQIPFHPIKSLEDPVYVLHGYARSVIGNFNHDSIVNSRSDKHHSSVPAIKQRVI
jgi:hypothetical protein